MNGWGWGGRVLVLWLGGGGVEVVCVVFGGGGDGVEVGLVGWHGCGVPSVGDGLFLHLTLRFLWHR